MHNRRFIRRYIYWSTRTRERWFANRCNGKDVQWKPRAAKVLRGSSSWIISRYDTRGKAAIREGKERERGVHDVKNRRKEERGREGAGWLSECDLGREFTMQYQWNTSPPRQPSSASSIVWFNRNCFMKSRLACGIKEKLVLEEPALLYRKGNLRCLCTRSFPPRGTRYKHS